MAANAAISVTGIEDIQMMLSMLPEANFQDAKDAFAETTFKVHGTVVKRLQGNPMQSRTGNLAKSIIPNVSGNSLGTLKASVYSTASYARIHELGGEVNAKDKYLWLPGGPYLNIPTNNNKTGAGVMKMSSTAVFSGGGKVMTGPEGFGLYLNGARMFRFARKVKIPARLGMLDAGVNEVPTLLSKLEQILLSGFAKP